MRSLANAIVGAVATAGVVTLICIAYGGGGLVIPGAVGTLAGAAGVVGFLAGLIAWKN